MGRNFLRVEAAIVRAKMEIPCKPDDLRIHAKGLRIAASNGGSALSQHCLIT
jgi:hypothetical protein